MISSIAKGSARPKVVVAGHICLDITPVFPQDLYGTSAVFSDILAPGRLARVRGVDIHAGGVVANTGLAMALFGADVCLMGKIGMDEFGSMILDLLREGGSRHDSSSDVTRGMIVSPDVSTSYSIVIAPPGRDRLFLHDPGANDGFRVADLDMKEICASRLFHFGYPTLMSSMYAASGRELSGMFRAIDRLGVMTSLDLSSIDERSESGKADWEAILADTLPHVDFFMPSFEELAYMLDRKKLERLRSKAEGGDVTDVLSVRDDVAPLAGRAIELGAKVALVKCGARGLFYLTADAGRLEPLGQKFGRASDALAGDGSCGGAGSVARDEEARKARLLDWASRSGFEKSYVPGQVVSGTGAGDTTIAAFLSAMLEGYPFEWCIQLAVATGASCVECWDALGGLKSFAELEAKIESGWKKNESKGVDDACESE
jgi:sugar/nucleoside kinase (ribokinase family)